MNLSDMLPGCYIDGSHMGPLDFAVQVIDLAHEYGFEMNWEQFIKDVTDFRNGDVDDEWLLDVMDSIDWTYEDALEYLNSNTREGLYWEVIEQNLCLVEVVP